MFVYQTKIDKSRQCVSVNIKNYYKNDYMEPIDNIELDAVKFTEQISCLTRQDEFEKVFDTYKNAYVISKTKNETEKVMKLLTCLNLLSNRYRKLFHL